MYIACWELPRWHSGEESTCQCRRHIRCRFDPWVRKNPWRRKWHLTPVFLPGKLHGERNLVGDSKLGRKECDTTEHTHTYTMLSIYNGNPSTVDVVMRGKVSSFWKVTLTVMQIIWGMCKRKRVKSLSCVRLLAIPWTVAHQVPLAMKFSRQQYWSGFPFPPPEDLLNPGIKPLFPALADVFFATVLPGKCIHRWCHI